jgi:hypothetical protein
MQTNAGCTTIDRSQGFQLHERVFQKSWSGNRPAFFMDSNRLNHSLNQPINFKSSDHLKIIPKYFS